MDGWMTEPAYTISSPGAFGSGELKMYRIYKNIVQSFQGDFKILVKSDIF